MHTKYLLSVEEVIEGLGLGRTSVFSLIKSGDLKAIKLGRRTFVRPGDLQEFLAKCPERAPRD